MKIYKVKFSDGYTKKTFIIAAINCGEALAMSKMAETGVLLDGTVVAPTIDCFDCEIIDGVTARTSGIKSIIY